MQDDAVRLNDVVITYELLARGGRMPDLRAERSAFTHLARQMSYGRGAILDALCQLNLKLCRAGSSGVSLLRGAGRDQYFVWEAVAGKLQKQRGSRLSWNSPCGFALERNSAQLFHYPDRYFTCIRDMEVPAHECLVVPLFREAHQSYGAIWVMSHDDTRQFDREDLRIVTELAAHATSALRIQSSQGAWEGEA
ncbi:GAF domain-containing protein [Noviherbaspirillum humi]|uniref:GAF domain-containing protein n=1 Tax=Noviherbaspirillum humi TaxID=1688639 RepID=A0A239G9U0_9BURK|nr:GAF domain-containing protein [Noviherbaspirillum humi]SNS65472.1 GAF domain-containing protein [Noviherbaspirillum humi]